MIYKKKVLEKHVDFSLLNEVNLLNNSITLIKYKDNFSYFYELDNFLNINQDFESDGVYMYLDKINDSLLFLKKNDRQIIYELNDRQLIPKIVLSKEYSFDNSSRGFGNNNLRLFKRKNGVKLCNLFDIEKEEVLFEKYVPGLIKLFSDKILSQEGYTVRRFDINGEKLWEKNLVSNRFKFEDQYRKILTIIGISDGVIICRYDNGQVGIGIDVETGDVKWIEEGAFTVAQLSEDGKLFSLGPPMTVRDVQTGKVVGIFGELDDRIRSGRLHYTTIGDHIIITGTPTDTIAAFNTKTHKLDWVHKEEGVWFNAVPMKYFHPYLFVNDSKGNLHVFEVSDEMAKIKNNNLLT